MDEYEYFDDFFYSPTWSDIDLKQRSQGLCSESGQPNALLLSSVGVNEVDNNNSHTSMINSNGITESLAAQDASSVVFSLESDYGISMGLHSGQAQLQEDDQNNFFGNGMVNGGGCQYDMSVPSNGDLSGPSLPFPEVGLMLGNAFEPSDFQTLSPIPHLSPLPSLEGVSSLSPGFDLQGREYFDNDLYAMESRSSNSSASLSSKGAYSRPNFPSSSFASGPQMTRTTVGLQSVSQTTSTTSPGEFNGIVKPRVRARRGQATDPHSIAERLRREKIADRMKSLQELLPNPNKTDKASMLDEIIEYVKFLQLQVKVLSTSRLGADGAVEGVNGLVAPPSSGQIADIVFSSHEISFERELLKLMESNVTKAMQYLQTKDLCLMPVALASAMSAGKEKESSSSSSSSAPLSDDGKRNGTHQMPSNGNAMLRIPTTESNTMVSNECVVAAKPVEDGENTSLTAKELKPKI